jgi:diguanylate cyclase (GGDEF)-like protein
MEIGNRRAMEVDLDHTHSSALRYNQIYSLLLLDVDYFKLYNDSYGHQKGDEALKDIANIMKKHIRASDRLYRYGGEELLLLLPSTDAEEAYIVAKKLVSSVQDQAIPHRESPIECLTMSSGCTSVCKNTQEKYSHWEEAVEVADKALYRAKKGGRNRVETALPE